MISSYTMAGFVLLRLYLCVWVFALIVDSCVYLFVALGCLTKVDLILMRSADLYKHTHALTDSLIFVVFFFWTTDIQQGKKDVEMTIITVMYFKCSQSFFLFLNWPTSFVKASCHRLNSQSNYSDSSHCFWYTLRDTITLVSYSWNLL